MQVLVFVKFVIKYIYFSFFFASDSAFWWYLCITFVCHGWYTVSQGNLYNAYKGRWSNLLSTCLMMTHTHLVEKKSEKHQPLHFPVILTRIQSGVDWVVVIPSPFTLLFWITLYCICSFSDQNNIYWGLRGATSVWFDHIILSSIGHFRVPLCLCFKVSLNFKTILMKMTLICIKMKLHSELIFIWKVLHFDSSWNRGTWEPRNGLLKDWWNCLNSFLKVVAF